MAVILRKNSRLTFFAQIPHSSQTLTAAHDSLTSASKKTLNGEISKYVHPSSAEIEPVIKEGKVEPNILFKFDEELFDKCVNFTSKIMDIFILILLNSYSLLEEKIKEDKLMIKMIERFSSRLSLRYLNSY